MNVILYSPLTLDKEITDDHTALFSNYFLTDFHIFFTSILSVKSYLVLKKDRRCETSVHKLSLRIVLT